MQNFISGCLFTILAHQVILSSGTLFPQPPDCGYNSDTDRIIGGQNASFDAYPWLALIEYEKISSESEDPTKPKFYCGGSLINSWYVITAAHCKIPDNKAMTVTLGDHTISTDHDCETTENETYCVMEAPQVIPIDSFIIHEDYVPNVKRKDLRGGQNDIGLIRLKFQARSHFFVAPICLPTKANLDLAKKIDRPKTIVVAGWGVSEKGIRLNIKQLLKIPLIDSKECGEKYPNRIISEGQVCGESAPGKYVCSADRGGPLMELHVGKPPFWTLLGVLSYAPKCTNDINFKPLPSVYLRVDKYLDWIESKMQ